MFPHRTMYVQPAISLSAGVITYARDLTMRLTKEPEEYSLSVRAKRETTMKDDEKERLERATRRMEAFISEVRPAERLCLKLSAMAFTAWIVMLFIFRLRLEVASLALIAAVFLFGMYALLRMARIDILSILNDLNELL